MLPLSPEQYTFFEFLSIDTLITHSSTVLYWSLKTNLPFKSLNKFILFPDAATKYYPS
jgi:hypothetical protein